MNIFIDYYPEDNVEIVDDDYNHLKAQRKRLGDRLNIIPITGNKYVIAEIVELNKKTAILKVLAEKEKPELKPPDIILYQAIAKKQKMDLILQKATELGVNTIVPLVTQNIVPKAEKINIERWEKIVKEAAIQSRRYDLPVILKPQSIKTIKGSAHICCLAEREADHSFRKYLEKLKFPDKIEIIIGAEGGFSNDELLELKEKGIALVSFGSNILRTETAAISAMGVLRWFYE